MREEQLQSANLLVLTLSIEQRRPADTASTAFEWVKAVWRAFGGGSGFAHVI